MKKIIGYSCLGCVGVVVLLVVFVVTLGWASGRKAKFTETRASYDPISVSDLADSPDLAGTPGTVPNRISLTVSGVDTVEVRPCDPGEGLAVEASYNENRFEFSETMVEGHAGQWAYNVEMKGQGAGLIGMVEKLFTGRQSTLAVCLPREVPIEFVTNANATRIEAEFGGLWLTSVDLVLDKSGGVIQFGEPLREPMEFLSIDATMSGGVITGLGHASPGALNLDYRFGGFQIMMDGEWRRDTLITLAGQSGGINFTFTNSVRVAGVPDLPPGAGVSEETTPTVTFAPGTDFEDVTVTRQ